jgi:peptidoglycan/LPS O-acetylase OafA/YrhL
MLVLYVALETVALLKNLRVTSPPFAGAFTGQYTPDAILPHLLLIQGLGFKPPFTWNGAAWSISTEFYACAVFAVVCLLLAKIGANRRVRLAVNATITIISLLILLRYGSDYATGQGVRFFRCLAGFFTGCVSYEFACRYAISQKWAAPAELCAVVAVVAFVTSAGGTWFDYATPFVFATVIWLFAAESGPVSALLKTSFPQRLGMLSYSIYMVHGFIVRISFLVAHFVEKLFHLPYVAVVGYQDQQMTVVDFGGKIAGDLAVLVFLAVVVLAATVTYKFIEEPCRSYFNALAASRFAPRPLSGLIAGARKP